MNTPQPTPAPSKIQMNIDPDKIAAQYSDSAFINHNPFGFVFDFAQNIPPMKMLKIVSRIAVSPQHAKAFLGALQSQIKAYEAQHGEIKLSAAMQAEADKKPIGFDVELDKKSESNLA